MSSQRDKHEPPTNVCFFCGGEPVADIGQGYLLCRKHQGTHMVRTCPSCDGTGLYANNVKWNRGVCDYCEAALVLGELPTALVDEMDVEIRSGRAFNALKRLLDRKVPGVSFTLAQDVIWVRESQLGFPPKPPPRVPPLAELIATAKTIRPKPAAIEAIWDGDTSGWFVVLLAITQGASARHPRFGQRDLAVLSSTEGDIRLFTGEVPPWPEATRATELGEAIASALNVPFCFSHPDEPRSDGLRWWDSR